MEHIKQNLAPEEKQNGQGFGQNPLQASSSGISMPPPPLQLQAGSGVIQRGQANSTKKKGGEDPIPEKLQYYLDSSRIDHGEGKEGPRDDLMKEWARIYEDWKANGQIKDWWLVNQSNMKEYQGSYHTQRGGACFYFCLQFLKEAEKGFMAVKDLLDRYNRGDVANVITYQKEMSDSLAGLKQRAKKSKELLASRVNEKDKLDEEKAKGKDADEAMIHFYEVNIKMLTKAHLLAKEKHKELEDSLRGRARYPKQISSPKPFSGQAIIDDFKKSGEKAIQVNLLRDGVSGHGVAFYVTKDFSGANLYYFLDPNLSALNGDDKMLEKAAALLQRVYGSKYTSYSFMRMEIR